MDSLHGVAAESLFPRTLVFLHTIMTAGHDGYNIIPIIINEKGVDLDGTLSRLGDYHEQDFFKFQAQQTGLLD
ncbi:hypothetical protein BJV74DRAFT_170524 [Russula compacta]|nr:hypothetical protein BJV74DRAFT_170524 [Russula compacta]